MDKDRVHPTPAAKSTGQPRPTVRLPDCPGPDAGSIYCWNGSQRKTRKCRETVSQKELCLKAAAWEPGQSWPEEGEQDQGPRAREAG